MNIIKLNNMKSMLFATAAVAGIFIAGNGANAHADTTNNQNTTIVSQSQHVESHETVTVKAGDTLWGIAQSHNVKLDALRVANQRQNSDLIYVGEKLVLPNGNTMSVPAQSQTSQQTAQPAQAVPTAPKVQQAAPQTQTAPTAQATANYQQVSVQATNTATSVSDSNAAKSWIAQHESSGSYTATNGQYYGKYQLSASLLHGDYSAANQEKVADQYVTSRYGSWDNAKSFWVKNGWY
jgi:LysM repeat protein